MMRPLLRGATTVVIPDDVIYDPKALIRFLEEYGITETLVAFSPRSRSELERPRCGREALEAKDPVAERRGRHPHARAARHGAVAGCAPAQRLQLQRDPRGGRRGSGRAGRERQSTYCAVGAPMDPEHLYLLDADGERVPEGEAGELFVGGECLARGYVELPEKTEESFPEDPFSSKNGAKMYRSGDRARILSDGSLEILGRVDFMVKIRGYSVELGAVEAAIERASP